MDGLQFQLQLIDKLTKPGREMASQMQKLKLQLNASSQAVRQTEQALAKLQRAKVVDIASYRQLTAQLAQAKAGVNNYQQSILGLSGQMNEGEAGMKSFAGSMSGVVSIMKIFGAVYAAEIAVIGAGMAMSIHASELKNDTLDALEAFMGTAEAAETVYSRINKMSGKIAISQERGTSLARELSAAGVTNADALTNAIESIGMVESVLGGGAGSKIQSIIERSTAGGTFKLNAKSLAGTGVQMSGIASALGITEEQLNAQLKAGKITAEQGISAMTKAINNKFSAVAGKQVLDIGAQFTKARDDISKLFEDVDTDGFLKGLKEILSVFDQSTVSGQALKFVVTSIFNGLFKVVEAVSPFVKAFFKGLIIIALQVYIAFKPLIAQISQLFGGDQKANVEGFAGAMIQVGAAVGAMTAYTVGLIQTGITLFEWFIKLETFLMELPAKFYNAGAAIVTGLVGGIKSAGGAAVDAVKNIGADALSGFKSIFGIASPSKVMGEMGGHLMTGLEQGIDGGAGGAQSAMQSSVAPPVAAAGGSGGGSSSVQVTVAPGAIVISGVQNAQQVAEMLPEMLANVMENLMLQQGAAA